jgi:hypothetical protein
MRRARTHPRFAHNRCDYPTPTLSDQILSADRSQPPASLCEVDVQSRRRCVVSMSSQSVALDSGDATVSPDLKGERTVDFAMSADAVRKQSEHRQTIASTSHSM